MTTERWKITLVDRTQFFRRPRSKKRRILKKWWMRKENHRPLMTIFQIRIFLGENSVFKAYGNPLFVPKPDPYWNEQDHSTPRILEMHSLFWEKTKNEDPEFAAKCDVFRIVKNDPSPFKWPTEKEEQIYP